MITYPRIDKQNGLALVTVLLIVGMITTLQVFMIEQQHLLIRQAGNQGATERSYQYALGANAWAMQVLIDDENPVIDFNGERWYKFGREDEVISADGEQAGETPPAEPADDDEDEDVSVVDFGIEGLDFRIDDLQGRFNLNNLANKEPTALRANKTIFMNLLELLQVSTFDDRERLYGSLLDWIDENDLISANGYESGDYQIAQTPYYASDQMLTSIGELRFVEGFTEEVIRKLKPYVTVLPINDARINLNTASAEVVASLSSVPVSDIGSVAGFLAVRDEAAFSGFLPTDIQEAESAIIAGSVTGRSAIPNMLQTHSQFFSINARVELGDYRYCMRTRVIREGGGPAAGSTAPKVRVLSREYDTYCEDSRV